MLNGLAINNLKSAILPGYGGFVRGSWILIVNAGAWEAASTVIV